MTMNYINQYHKESCERKMRKLEAWAKEPFDCEKAAARSRRMYAELMEQERSRQQKKD